MAVLFLMSLMYGVIAVLTFQISGHAIGDLEPDELTWGRAGSLILGGAIIIGPILWGALAMNPAWRTAARSWIGENWTRPSNSYQEPTPTSHRLSKASRAYEAAVQRQLEQRNRDLSVQQLVRSNPDVGEAVRWMIVLLDEQFERNRRDVAQAGRKEFLRDVAFLIAGSLLGVVVARYAGPLVAQLPG